ncbi:hypothetical protein GQ53DRAFT_642613 [Thozetella sp. PMI_491]|nr:hypothetical protein GQ53DRAFT_642613 [Thozetella sp. PMI_491]
MAAWSAHIEALVVRLNGITPAQWCQGFYVFAASACLAVATLPQDARRLLLDYGARGSKQDGERGWLFDILGAVTSWTQVPHSWFSTFYGIFLVLSLFWFYQYLGHGAVLLAVVSGQASAPGSPSMTFEQTAAVLVMMILQAARRLYEQAAIMKPSSQMWVAHWILGLSFYVVMSVAVWVEGSGNNVPLAHFHKATVAAIPLVLFAWVNQYRCHKQLAGLRKYSVPEGGLFRWFVCPHYFCECLFYASLALAGAPTGQLCNTTILTAVLFVAVNLGITAAGTRVWYADKFGPGSVERKWNMIPFLF